jgi:F0F1-type ATP synthase assembly protein I
MAVYVGVAFVCLFLGMIIGSAKGFTGLGLVLGLLLGPLGVLIVACMKATPEVQAKREVDIEAARAKLQNRPPDIRA